MTIPNNKSRPPIQKQEKVLRPAKRSSSGKGAGIPKDIQGRARMERGMLLISFTDIPDEQMPKLVDALMDSLASSHEAA